LDKADYHSHKIKERLNGKASKEDDESLSPQVAASSQKKSGTRGSKFRLA
jgi:hypothetical protein